MWAWIKHVLGFDVRRRVRSLETRMTHNENAIDGALAAFKQFAKDARK